MPGKPRLCALVVDDNADAASTLAQVLRLMGCDASFVTDPRQALQEALRLRPHIAFLDLGMPQLSGYQLAKDLRQHFPPEELKIVAITGHGSFEDRQASRRAGFDEDRAAGALGLGRIRAPGVPEAAPDDAMELFGF